MADTTSAAPAVATATPATSTVKNGASAVKPPTSSGSATDAPRNGSASHAEAPEKGETTSTEPPKPKKYKVKIDDSEEEVEEAELLRGYQKGAASNRRFQEAKKLRDETEAFVNALKENPRAALRQFGLDVKKLSEEELLDHLRWEQMTPEQRRLAEYEHKEREWQEKERRRTEEETAKASQAEVLEWQKRYDDEFQAALKDSGLPMDADTVYAMAELMRARLDTGIPYSAHDAVSDLKARTQTHVSQLLGGMSGDQILDFLGDFFDKASTAKIARVRGQQQKAPAQRVFSPPPVTKPKNEDDWNAHLARIIKGG